MPQQFDPRVQQALQQLQGGMQQTQRHPLQDFAVDLGTLLTSNATPRELVDNRDIARGKLGELQQKMAIANLKGTLEALQNQSLLENMASENILTKTRTRTEGFRGDKAKADAEAAPILNAARIKELEASANAHLARMVKSQGDEARARFEHPGKIMKQRQENIGKSLSNEQTELENEAKRYGLIGERLKAKAFEQLEAGDPTLYFQLENPAGSRKPTDYDDERNIFAQDYPGIKKLWVTRGQSGDAAADNQQEAELRTNEMMGAVQGEYWFGDPEFSQLKKMLDGEFIKFKWKLIDQAKGLDDNSSWGDSRTAALNDPSMTTKALDYARASYWKMADVLASTIVEDGRSEWDHVLEDLAEFTGLTPIEVEKYMQDGKLPIGKYTRKMATSLSEDIKRTKKAKDILKQTAGLALSPFAMDIAARNGN